VDLARRFADRIAGVRNGRIVLDAPASEFGEDAFRAVFQPAGPATARDHGLADDHIETLGARLERSLDCA
jgi:ABC-type phosphate/phosphonate transport system ATPase subunit